MVKIQEITVDLLSKISFDEPRNFGSGKFIPFSEPLRITLPKMTAPFGISSFGDNGKFTLPTNVDDKAAQAGLLALDSWAKNMIQKNPDWLGRRGPLSDDVVDMLYCRQLKAGKGVYAPTTKVALKFDQDGEPIFSHTGVQNGYAKGAYLRHQVQSLVEITGFWVAAARAGLTSNLLRLHVDEPVLRVRRFLDDDESFDAP